MLRCAGLRDIIGWIRIVVSVQPPPRPLKQKQTKGRRRPRVDGWDPLMRTLTNESVSHPFGVR